ncbi:MAG TPA: TolC family protein [Bacteroides sp.]|nr:TolC family protein [Bacteroides sp.]
MKTKRKTGILLVFLLTGFFLHAQDSITLFDCHSLATQHAPRMRDSDVIREMEKLNTKNIEMNWFPEVHVNGKLSYQSDVVTLAMDNPLVPLEFPEVPHDQYGLNLDLSQTLYDGGINRRLKALEQAEAEAELQQVEVDLYGIREQVNQLFFTTLVLQENRMNLAINLDNLTKRREVLQTSFENGMILESDLMMLDVEILRVKQAIVELEAGKKACMEALGVLCGRDFPGDVVLVKPFPEGIGGADGSRPEYRLFALKEASLDAGKELLTRKKVPILYAYGQTGYGKPGYNLLSNEWDYYYMVGAGIRWKLWDWNQSRREAMVLEQQKQLLRNRKDAFDQRMESLKLQERAKMEQYRETLELDEQVLALQKKITARAASELENGTLTATDYLIELNKESQARIRYTTHQILLKQSHINYLTIQGNL